MDRSSVTENDVERARPKAAGARLTDDDRLVPSAISYLKADCGKRQELTDDDMAHAIGHGWTIGVGLRHLAFWDWLWHAKFEEWERTGEM